MGKLPVLLAAVMALVLGGCAGQVDGPEVFEFATEHSGVYLRSLEAAEQINATDENVLVTVRLSGPSDDLPINLAAYDPGFGPETDPEMVGIWTTSGSPVLTVGSEASAAAIEAGMYDWIAMFSARD